MSVETPASYPINVLLTNRRCVVIGGGTVADRKVQGLLAAGGRITIVAPDISPELRRRAAGGVVTIIERPYRRTDLDGAWLAIACTDDAAVNRRVFLDGEADGVLVNSADDPHNCAFTLPSVVRQGPLQITASTGGTSPALSMWLRRRFADDFDERWLDVVDLLAEVRTDVRARFGTSEVPGWSDALDAGAIDLVLAGDRLAARTLLDHHLMGVAA